MGCLSIPLAQPNMKMKIIESELTVFDLLGKAFLSITKYILGASGLIIAGLFFVTTKVPVEEHPIANEDLQIHHGIDVFESEILRHSLNSDSHTLASSRQNQKY